jgi:hypothetical protein
MPNALIKRYGGMEKNISKNQIWHKIISSFSKIGLKYVLVGGSALVIHGFPRSTLDIDIYIPAEKDALHKLFQSAKALGLESEQTAILNISHSPELFSNQWICFSYEGQDVLDVFLAETKVFNKLYKNSEEKQDEEISIRVASLRDLEVLKRSAGRPIDLSDIELIKQFKKYKKF